MSKPTLVLTHGSWHGPGHYAKVTKLLEEAGYKIDHALQPTSHATTDRASKSIPDDVAAIKATVERHLDAGEDVVLVTHSYGTIVGLSALAGLDGKSRAAKGSTSAVVAVAVIAGSIAPPGITSRQMFKGELPAPCKVEDGMTLPLDPAKLLYSDVPADQVDAYASALSPQSIAIHTFPVPDMFTPVKDIPVSYLAGELDNSLPLPAAKQIVGALKANGVNVRAERVHSGHSPFVTKPEETARFVRRAAGEDVETGLQPLPEQ